MRPSTVKNAGNDDGLHTAVRGVRVPSVPTVCGTTGTQPIAGIVIRALQVVIASLRIASLGSA